MEYQKHTTELQTATSYLEQDKGSGASPAVWLTISVILLLALTALASVSMKFMDPWHDIFDEGNADAYVDDSANGASDAHQEEAMMLLTKILRHLQHKAQIWE